MTKMKKQDKGRYGIRGLLYSSLITFGIIIVISFIFSLIAASADNPIAKTDIFSLLSLIISGVVSSFICSKRFGMGKALLSSLFVILIMLLLGIVFSSGRLSGSAFMNYGCFFGTCAVGSYLGRKREKKHKIHKRR